jgi:hypothetical protein
MSDTALNFHRVTTATAKLHEVNNSRWLALDFVDAKGGTLSLAVFGESPAALLKSIAAGHADSHQWRPIETAPKDGTHVLGLLPGGRVVTIVAAYSVLVGPLKAGGGHDVVGAVFSGYSEIERDALCPQHPTHWMPKPPLQVVKEPA